MPTHPTAFISYTWDDDEHKAWVRDLAMVPAWWRFSLNATSTCTPPIGRRMIPIDRGRGRMKKLLEPITKPFILGLAEEIFGPRARFFIWLPFTTHPAELRARRDSCQMAQWLGGSKIPTIERFSNAVADGRLEHILAEERERAK